MGSSFQFDTTRSRSELMKKIRSKNTTPEILLRKNLWKLGIRYRLNYPKLPGKPDIFIKKNSLVIFIDGEFWHGFNWENKKERLKSNREYWIKKIEGNIKRDQRINVELTSMGYCVLRFWGNEVKSDIKLTNQTSKGD